MVGQHCFSGSTNAVCNMDVGKLIQLHPRSIKAVKSLSARAEAILPGN